MPPRISSGHTDGDPLAQFSPEPTPSPSDTLASTPTNDSVVQLEFVPAAAVSAPMASDALDPPPPPSLSPDALSAQHPGLTQGMTGIGIGWALSFACGVLVGTLVWSAPDAPVMAIQSGAVDVPSAPDYADVQPALSPLEADPPLVPPMPAPDRAGAAVLAVASAAASQDDEEGVDAPFVGSLSISSSPPGAVVFLNGESIGATPLLLRDQPIGSRALRVELDGYDAWSSGIRVVADQRTFISARLTPRR